MTTATPRPDEALTIEEIEERKLDAWTAYSDSLRDLTGEEYDEAEARSWERLQRKLAALEGRHGEAVDDTVESHSA